MRIKEIGDSEFEELVINSNKPVLLFSPFELSAVAYLLEDVIDYIQTIYDDTIEYYKINPKKSSAIKERYQVSVSYSSAVFIFNNGELIEKIVGLIGYSELVIMINNVLIKINAQSKNERDLICSKKKSY